MTTPSPRARAAPPGLLLFVAWSSLFKSRLTVALLLGAVAAGVGFQVPNSANLAGYDHELLEEGVAAGMGDVRLRPLGGARFDDGDALATRAAIYPGVRAAVPMLTLPGAIGEGGHFVGVPVNAVDAAAARSPFRIAAGRSLGRGEADGVLVGSAVAGRLGVRVGDVVQLRVILAAGGLGADESLGKYQVTVRGIAAGTFGAYESVFVDRAFLAREIGEPHAASTVLVYGEDHAAAPLLASRMGSEIPDLLARAWMDDMPYLRSSVHANRALFAVSNAMVVAAVAIPVCALLYINVLSRRREIALLSALGFRRSELFVAFLLQALVTGVLGALIGCGLGYGLIRWFSAHPIFEWEGFVIRPAMELACFVRPSLIVLAATVCAGVYPAARAARLDPATVLRGGE